MADANPPNHPDEAGDEPQAAPPSPTARRFARPGADDRGGAVEDETHDGSVALLAAWG